MSKIRQRPKKFVAFVCGPTRAFFYGDPHPGPDCSYFDFVEWQEAQFRKRRRPKRRTRRAQGNRERTSDA